MTPRRRRQVCEKTRRRRRQESPISGESTKETVKTIACGNAGCSGATVVTTLVCYQHFAHEAAGAAGTRRSPRPLLGEKFTQRLGRIAPRGANACPADSIGKRRDVLRTVRESPNIDCNSEVSGACGRSGKDVRNRRARRCGSQYLATPANALDHAVERRVLL